MAEPNGQGGWELTDDDLAEIATASGWFEPGDEEGIKRWLTGNTP
jgi:hypothetical protein